MSPAGSEQLNSIDTDTDSVGAGKVGIASLGHSGLEQEKEELRAMPKGSKQAAGRTDSFLSNVLQAPEKGLLSSLSS